MKPPKKKKRKYVRRVRREEFFSLSVGLRVDPTVTLAQLNDAMQALSKMTGVRQAFIVGAPVRVAYPSRPSDEIPF